MIANPRQGHDLIRTPCRRSTTDRVLLLFGAAAVTLGVVGFLLGYLQ